MMVDDHFAKTVLHEIAVHAFGLGMGLQNAAPTEGAKEPSKSIQYLFAISRELQKLSEEIEGH